MAKDLGFLFSSLAAHEEAPSSGIRASPENPLRTSSYTIYIDLPNDHEMLLVHGYLGSYDLVSRSVAAYLRSLEPRQAPKPLYGVWSDKSFPDEEIAPPSDETLRLLKQRGYLTRRTVTEEEAFFKDYADKIHEQNVRGRPSYIIMPTYNCNLRCHYCFQDHMRTDPAFKPLLRTMSMEMVDRIFEAVPKIDAMHGIQTDDKQKRSFTLFGGEPLLARSRSIVESIIDRIKSLGPASIHTISNATELDAYEDLLGPGLLSSIQITLDGPPGEHDQRRIYPDGSGSFKKIAKNIDLALERKVSINVRLNLDRNNIEDLPAVIATVMAHGWHEHEHFNIYAAPIRSEKKSPEIMNSWQLAQEMNRLRREQPDLKIIARPDEGLRSRAKKMFAEPGTQVFNLKPVFCSAHNRMYIFDAFGDIYACWEKTGDTKIRMGHITENGEVNLNRPVCLQWRTRTVTANPVCSKCRYAMHCGGGCAVLAEGRSGKLHANFCDGFAARFRSVLADEYLSSTLAENTLAV
jgi:uncharacterized protein